MGVSGSAGGGTETFTGLVNFNTQDLIKSRKMATVGKHSFKKKICVIRMDLYLLNVCAWKNGKKT